MTHESDSWWEIPWIAYFVSLFKHPFNITEFSILEFEDSLNKDDQASQLFFTDLIIELLRGLYQNPKIDESSYEELLRDICRARLMAEKAMFNPLESSETDFFDLTRRLRVWIVYKLCCWKVEDEQAITDAIDIKESNLESMGEDRHGNLFWYFGGIHLYRESKPSGDWEVVAKTRDQWRSLRDSFKDSSDKEEIWFRETIEQNFDPILSGMETEIYSWSKNKHAARKVCQTQG